MALQWRDRLQQQEGAPNPALGWWQHQHSGLLGGKSDARRPPGHYVGVDVTILGDYWRLAA